MSVASNSTAQAPAPAPKRAGQRPGKTNGNKPRPLAAVPDSPPEPPDGACPVPGSTGWAYRPGVGVWRLPAGADEWVSVLGWCPTVADAVRYPSQDGRTIATAYKLVIGEQTEVVSAGDLVRGAAWPRFHAAYGFTGRQMGDVLVNIVTAQSSALPDIIGYPCFGDDGRLRLPPTEYLPDGYTNGEGSAPAALRSLVAAVAPYPVAALQMGLSALAPWVGPLELQPFTLHVVGDSTVGKSTGLYAAAALWGTAYRRVAPPWAGTKIGIPGSFRDLGALPAFRDELGTAGLGGADRATLFTNIMEGCRRIARTRDDLARPSASWASACLSTGNISAVPAGHASAGTPKGVIEIHADTVRPVIPPEAKGPVRKATNAREVAGAWVPFAAKLPFEGVRLEWDRAYRDLGGHDADGLAWHMCRAMALALVGARVLAEVAGVAELAANAERAAREVIADTADRLSEIGADHGARLADTVAELVDAYPAAFGLDPDASGRIEQIGFMSRAQDGAELTCIYPNRHADVARRAEVEDATAALRQLRDSGQLRTTRGKGLRYGAWRNNRTVHVYAYNLGVQAGGNEGKGGKGAGQGVTPSGPPGGKSDPGQGVREPESPAGASWEPAPLVADEIPLPPDPGPDEYEVAGRTPAPAVTPPRPPKRPTCITPGCGIAGRLYPSGAFCDAHGPGAVRPVPAPVLPEPEPEPVAEPEPEGRPEVADDDELATFARSVRKLDADATDADISAALAIFHEVTGGVRWVSYAGQVGQAWFAKLAAQYPSMKAPEPLAWSRMREVTESGPLTRINYVAKPGKVVRAGKHHVTSYDLNGQHLAACSSAELGDGEPEVIADPRSIEGLTVFPGYVRLGSALKTGHPAFGTRPAGEWVAMPLVRFLVRDLGLSVPAAEVVYWPRKGRRLSVYAARVRDARERLVGAEQTAPVRLALAVVKSQANAFVGMFHSETYSHGGFYRPDWYDQIVATAEANALRALAKCPVPPVAKMADSAYWIADAEPYVPEGLTISAQLGKWKLDRRGPVTDDLITAIKSHGPAGVRDAVIAIDAERGAGR